MSLKHSNFTSIIFPFSHTKPTTWTSTINGAQKLNNFQNQENKNPNIPFWVLGAQHLISNLKSSKYPFQSNFYSLKSTNSIYGITYFQLTIHLEQFLNQNMNKWRRYENLYLILPKNENGKNSQHTKQKRKSFGHLEGLWIPTPMHQTPHKSIHNPFQTSNFQNQAHRKDFLLQKLAKY